MEELDDYGNFNSRYEGVGQIVYVNGEHIPVYFEARQLYNGRLLVACVSTGGSIKNEPQAIDGRLLSGEPFSTMRGRGIKEIYRNEGSPSKAHYVANMIRVRHTKDVQPDNRAVQLALHNFIPGPLSDVSKNEFSVTVKGCELIISPVGNYKEQVDKLLRFGGNIRTCWVKAKLTDDQNNLIMNVGKIEDIVFEMLAPISLSLGTLVTCPQVITFDAGGNRNDVEYYTTRPMDFSDYVPAERMDSPIHDTITAWFSSPHILDTEDLRVYIHQHLDACSTKVFLESRALVAATLLDVIASNYANRYAPKEKTFRGKLSHLLKNIGIDIDMHRLDTIVKNRNSLVHSGDFVTSENSPEYIEYQNIMRLVRSILLRIVGVPSMLHETLDA